jgi:molybdenum cofactor biosynthesis enzyme MoaA
VTLPVVRQSKLAGGEPTLYKDLDKVIEYNQSKNLKTTIYTNGYNLSLLENKDLINVNIRIGILGLYKQENWKKLFTRSC